MGRALAERLGYAFADRKAYIQDTRLGAGFCDAVISNGVINLAPDKTSVFREAARILKPGARLALADIVTESRLAEGITCDATLWAACRSCSEIREFEHSFWTLVIGR
jgi:SAM-dependent methyltransferase